jgi:hypothetical protein
MLKNLTPHPITTQSLRGEGKGEGKIKKPIPVFEISALLASSISFPNTGGMTVSSHALTASFHFPERS